MNREAIIQAAIDSMVQCDEELALRTINQAIEAGLDPVEILAEGFSAGIRKVGDQFGMGQLFLPELILSAEVMKKVSAIVDDAVAKKGQTTTEKGTMVMATVEGDVHDIGKGIVVSLIKTQGIKVIDLGRDVSVATIIEKAEEYQADLIGTSALLTTTMEEQKKLEEALKAQGLRNKYKTMVGGAPCTQRWADRIGADAFAEDAAEAVTKAIALLK